MKNQSEILHSLIKRIKNNEMEAFEELYNRLWHVVYYLAYRHVNDKEAAKDIAQEAFVIVNKKINTLENDFAFNAWLNRTVINLCYRYNSTNLKHNYIDLESIGEEIIEENVEFLPIELLQNKNKQDQILEIISNLPMKLRSVILLYYFEEMTIIEISEVLELSVGAIHKRLSQAKNLLHEKFSKEFKSNGKTISNANVLTLLFINDSKIICTYGTQKTILNGVRKELNYFKKPPLNITFIKLVVIIVTIVAGIYGVIQVTNSDNSQTIVKEVDNNTLATFVGQKNADLIEGWHQRDINNGDKFALIVNEYGLELNNYIVDETASEMYVLFTKTKGDYTLYIIERYKSDIDEWNVVYEILPVNRNNIKTNEIKQWFEELEK